MIILKCGDIALITKAIVRSINDKGNRCIVRMPLFETASSKTPVEAEALVSITPGFFDNLFVGDVVFVAFEENALEKPIIVGKLYKGTSFETNTPGGMGIVDNFNVRTTASMPGYTTYFRYPDTINNPEYKHFITPKKIADHIKWLEAFTKERLSQIAKNFNCFKNWTQWQLRPENVEIDDGDIDDAYSKIGKVKSGYNNKYVTTKPFAYQKEDADCAICGKSCDRKNKRSYTKIQTDTECPDK